MTTIGFQGSSPVCLKPPPLLAFKLIRVKSSGENTALALENHLSKLEQKIDELLAAVEDGTHNDQQESRDDLTTHHEEADSSKSASK